MFETLCVSDITNQEKKYYAEKVSAFYIYFMFSMNTFENKKKVSLLNFFQKRVKFILVPFAKFLVYLRYIL